MAASYDSIRLRHQRNMDERLSAEHRRMAQAMALEIMRAADATGVIPNTTPIRETLRTRMWERHLKPYYIGEGADPLNGPLPQSPYAQLLVDGIEGATRIQSERQAALVRRVVRDPTVADWLTGASGLLQPSIGAGISLSPSRATLGGLRGPDGRIDVDRARAALVRPRGFHDPFYRWVDPNGYRLSDRIWQTGINVRSRIDALMSYEISQGTSATEIARMLEPFLTPAGAATKTTKPYGSSGSYAARRLARTEITVGARRATVDTAIANPFVSDVKWNLSRSHPKIDICDDLARGGPNGDGVYPLDQVPDVPHPHCCLPGQMVQTHRGDIPIEQVKENDFVLTHEGRYRPVLAAWATPHDGKVYEFETAYGTVELTGNHPLFINGEWVNAEDVQLGDKVMYAGVSVALDLALREAEHAPAALTQPSVSPGILFDIVPMRTIALDGDMMSRQGKVNDIATDAQLFDKGDVMPLQRIGHERFQVGTGLMATVALDTAETLMVMAFFDSERLPTVLADDCDAAIEGFVRCPTSEVSKTGVVSALGAADFAPDFGSFGRVRVTRQVNASHSIAHGEAAGDASRAVVFLPTGGHGIASGAHGDVMQGKQVAQGAIGDAVPLEDLGTRESLLDVDVNEQSADGDAVFSFKPRCMKGDADGGVSALPRTKALPLESIGAFDGESFLASLTNKRDPAGEVVHDNLLSLSPDDSVGRESGNPLVGGLIMPTQALIEYTPILAIRQKHYTGPVYNMEVADDHSYTVNGAACHNCLCYQTPVPTGATSDLVETLRADIAAARGNLIGAASGGNPERARALQGLLSPTRLTQSIMEGTLDDTIMAAAQLSQGA